MGVVKCLLLLCCIAVATATFSGFKWRGLGGSLYKRMQHHRNARQVTQQCLDALVALSRDPLEHCQQIYGVFEGHFEEPTEKNATDFCSPYNCGVGLLKTFNDVSKYCGSSRQLGVNQKEEVFLNDSCIIDPMKHTCLVDLLNLINNPPSSGQNCFTAFRSNPTCTSTCQSLLNTLKDEFGCCVEITQFALPEEDYTLLQQMWPACNMKQPTGCGKGVHT